MNKTALKNFAIWSRRKLIEQVQTKALLYGIDENNELHIEEQFGQLLINNQTYPLSMKPAFTALQKQLEQKGYKQLLEEVAYTWFNRIIAIRYMEVHEYLPEQVNVLSSSVGRIDPDILFEYDTMDLAIKHEKVRELINTGNTEAAFRILFVAQCNALNRILPFMFEPIQDYTELLLPEFLLDPESVIKTLVQNEELTESFAEIEVIGWLYQYYIAEEKGRVFAQKSKYKKEEIPFATQLFTPKWIVQYMVQNSLGRYWTEAHREDEDLIDNWEYFIKHEEEDFHEKIAPYVNKELKVEDIKLLDPAMGSGHILVYAFEVFYEIYEKCGYPERDISRLILENNLYGLDIDDRAYQLAAFAVVMKAASYSKRFLRSVEREGIELNLASIQETNHISEDVISYIAQQEVGERFNQVKAFFDQYHNAKTYGSLINITEREIAFLEAQLQQIENNPVEDLFYVEQHEIAKQVLPDLIHQTKIMRNEYDVVVMNPPYMGSGKMSKELNDFLKDNYSESKADLFAAFLEIKYFLKKYGFFSSITQHQWMFISSYKKLRNKIIECQQIDSMIHLGTRAFEEIKGEKVQSTTFVLRNYLTANKGRYIRLVNEKNALAKEKTALQTINGKVESDLYLINQKLFKKMPNEAIAYWVKEDIISIFEKFPKISDISEPRLGMATAGNDIFTRLWHEIEWQHFKFDANNRFDAKKSKKKWFPYNKGGAARKWYGNFEYVVDWEKDGLRIMSHIDENGKVRSHNYNLDYIFKKCITWNALSSTDFSARYTPNGFLFDNAGSSLFIDSEDDLYVILGLFSTKVVQYLLPLLNPTLNYQPGTIGSLPIIISKDYKKDIITLVKENIQISQSDWDDFESSWNFQKHPLLSFGENCISDAFNAYYQLTIKRYSTLKENEEKLNEYFISLYHLDDELSSEVTDSNINICIAQHATVASTFLSYFIGCLVGRYSLDIEGLIYAGGEWDNSKYNSIKPYNNAIVHFSDSHYNKDDIILRLREFLGKVFSPDRIDENIQWLAEALEMKNGEDAETRIRRYFLDEFFENHCKMYQKRPIYWLVDSGKQKGVRTLIYMHRYQPDTMATIRFEYLQEIQAKYQQEIADLENRLVNPNLSATDKKKLNAEKVSFEKKIDELREFDKRLAAIAAEEIEIDLDDGVKVNYEKLYRGGKGVLAKIK